MPILSCEISQSLINALQARVQSTGEPVDHIVMCALADHLEVSHATLFQVSTSGALVEGIFSLPDALPTDLSGTLEEFGLEAEDGALIVSREIGGGGTRGGARVNGRTGVSPSMSRSVRRSRRG